MNTRLAAVALVFILLPIAAFAHCDTMSGPVVTDAKKAIALHDVTPVLKWIGKTDEAEVRRLFEQTMSVRQLSPASQEIADRFFFETVVRLHRQGEGEPFSGLRDEDPEPAIRLTDASLSSGSTDELLQALNGHMKSELTRKFEAARAAKAEAGSSVEAGRRYVASYVELTHFVERVHKAIMESAGHEHHKQ